MRKLLLASCISLFANLVSGQFLESVSGESQPYNVPANLVRDHLTGSGIEILDVQFDGVPKAVGYFTHGNAAIGIDHGLVMTTGRVATMGTTYGIEATGSTFANNQLGFDLTDTLLAAQATGAQHDLVRYRITFRASSDSIRFRYVFASEEYPEYGCSQFNDIFGFFLEGPGIATPLNIALVPGTNLPVSINNVHPANPTNLNCTPLNTQFYHNNLNSSKQPVYDGFLSVFTAQAAVQPCGVYVMTLALADISDAAYDSAVFLEANSFNGTVDIAASVDPGEVILPENATVDTIRLRFNNIPPSLLPLTVKVGGMATNGVDYLPIDSVILVNNMDTVLSFLIQPIPDTLNEMLETITLTVRDTGCFYRVFTLYLADPDSTFSPLDSIIYTGNNLLKAPAPTEMNKFTWTGSNNIPVSISPVQTMVFSDILVDGPALPAFNDIIDTSLLASVCLNIEHAFDSDLGLYLFAPNGQFVELSTRNGGNGDNYTNTCFSPSATQPITFGMPFAPPSAAPFTGTFKPEGPWHDLLGAPLKGVWRLGLLDGYTGFQGQLLQWDLSFSGANLGGFKYLWSTGNTGASLLATDPGTYSVMVSNKVSAFSKTFVVYTTCNVYDSLNVVVAPGQTYNFGGQILTQPGFYSHTFAAANGCDSIVVVHLSLSTATVEAALGTTVHFSPNPSSQETMLRWDNGAGIEQVRAFDINGHQLFSQKLAGAETFLLKTAGWAPGWYIVELEDRQGKRAKGRLLVR